MQLIMAKFSPIYISYNAFNYEHYILINKHANNFNE